MSDPLRPGRPSGSRPAARALWWVSAAVLVSPATAHAYIDPGTGSLIVQALIGAALALRLTSKIWWRRSKRLLQRIFRPGGVPDARGE